MRTYNRTSPKHLEEYIKRIVELRKKHSVVCIGKQLGKDHSTISQMLRRHGHTQIKKICCDCLSIKPNNPAKKSWDDVYQKQSAQTRKAHTEQHNQLLIKLRADGHTVACIGNMFGVSRDNIIKKLYKIHAPILKRTCKCMDRYRHVQEDTVVPDSHPYAKILNMPVNRGKTYEDYLQDDKDRKRKMFGGVEK